MAARLDEAPDGGPALIDSNVGGYSPARDPGDGRSPLAAADRTRGRAGSGPEEYEHGALSFDRLDPYRFGPELTGSGVRFRLHAPSMSGVELMLDGQAPVAMAPAGAEWFAAEISGAGPGMRYRFRAGGLEFADPASRGQEEDAGGWSLVCGPLGPASDRAVRPWREAVIAEIHVGTATPEGSFAGLTRRLDHFADAGYTVIELMPIADFPGSHNWGYDGVLPFAPERSYGTPEELRALVDTAHRLGLAVILDVVYNHFGPVDNFLPHYAAAFFDPDAGTPWGAGPDFSNPTVRLFFLENVRHWLETYDMDGLRFDAVHEFRTAGADLFKRQLAAMARAIKPNAMLVIENVDNGVALIERDEARRPRHFDAQWNDDIHHALHVIATGQQVGYYRNFADGTIEKVRRALAEGFVRQGGPRRGDAGRGASPAHLPPSAFVSFIQNHDQIGNQPDGRRLADSLDADRLDFLHFVVMLSPQIPMFFMGEEAHIRAPFPFFGDLKGELGAEVRAGRAQQAVAFFEWDGAEALVPDPVSTETAAMARLAANAFDAPERREALERFRMLARLRREHLWPLTASPYRGSDGRHDGGVVAVRWRYDGGSLLMVLNAAPDPGTIEIAPFEPLASTGAAGWEGGRFRLGGCSAVIATLPPEAA